MEQLNPHPETREFGGRNEKILGAMKIPRATTKTQCSQINFFLIQSFTWSRAPKPVLWDNPEG